MVALRISNCLRTTGAAARYRATAAPCAWRNFTSTPRAFAQGYGDGNGGPTKAAFSKAMNKAADASAESGGSRSKEAKETGSSPTGGKIGQAKGGEALKGPQGKGAPKPKIYNQSVPGEADSMSKEQQREVDQHNAEFEERHDRATPATQDKVDKKFWKGASGAVQGP